MSRIHYFQRYSSRENTITNNTLQLIARIYNHSPELTSRLLTELIGVDIEIGLDIQQQTRTNASIPDGIIRQPSFKIVIETKEAAPTNPEQLFRHSKSFSQEELKILLLLTKTKNEDGALEAIRKGLGEHASDVIFQNVTFADLCACLDGLFMEHEAEMYELVLDYSSYCSEEGLLDNTDTLMRFVGCNHTLPLNFKYAMYYQPAHKSYTKHRYVGLYSSKAVRGLFDVDTVVDVTADGDELITTFVDGRKTDEYDDRIRQFIKETQERLGWDVSKGHRFFCGKELVETHYRKSSPGGMLGTRFVNLKDVCDRWGSVHEIAEELRDKDWG